MEGRDLGADERVEVREAADGTFILIYDRDPKRSGTHSAETHPIVIDERGGRWYARIDEIKQCGIAEASTRDAVKVEIANRVRDYLRSRRFGTVE